MKKIIFITAVITLMVFSMSAMACPTTGGGCGGDCGGQPCPECVGATEVTATLPSDLDHSAYYIWKVNLSIPTGQVITNAGLSIYGINDWQIEPDDVLHIRLLGASDISAAASGLGMHTKSYGYSGQDNQGVGDALGAYGQSIGNYTDDLQNGGEHAVTTTYTVWENQLVAGHYDSHHHWVKACYKRVLVTKTKTEIVNNPQDLCYSSEIGSPLYSEALASLIGTAPSVIGIGLDPDCHYDYDKIKFWYCTAPTPNVPAPGAILLGGIGVSIVGWMRKRRAL